VATHGADNTYNNNKSLQCIRGQIPRTILNWNYLSLVDVVEGWILKLGNGRRYSTVMTFKCEAVLVMAQVVSLGAETRMPRPWLQPFRLF
jgi:hypothetical protein